MQSSLTAFPPKGWVFSWAGWKLYRRVTRIPAKTADFKKISPTFLKHCPEYLIGYLERPLNGSKLHKANFTA